MGTGSAGISRAGCCTRGLAPCLLDPRHRLRTRTPGPSRRAIAPNMPLANRGLAIRRTIDPSSPRTNLYQVRLRLLPIPPSQTKEPGGLQLSLSLKEGGSDRGPPISQTMEIAQLRVGDQASVATNQTSPMIPNVRLVRLLHLRRRIVRWHRNSKPSITTWLTPEVLRRRISRRTKETFDGRHPVPIPFHCRILHRADWIAWSSRCSLICLACYV
jgi:hypothetical protein